MLSVIQKSHVTVGTYLTSKAKIFKNLGKGNDRELFLSSLNMWIGFNDDSNRCPVQGFRGPCTGRHDLDRPV